MWISKRVKHLKAISGLWWLAVNLVWGIVCGADVLITHYGTDSVKRAWIAAWYFPKWGWHVWAIGFLLITLIFVAEGSYRYDAKREKHNPRIVFPEVYLEYRDSLSMFDYSRLLVRVQNDLTAFSVKLSSPSVIGQSKSRMALLWDVPTSQVGQQAVHVTVRCVYFRKGDEEVADPIGGLPGEQIEEFLKQKAERPDEVIVSVDYLDVDGRACPTRRFRLFLHRNETNASKTVRCEPIRVSGKI